MALTPLPLTTGTGPAAAAAATTTTVPVSAAPTAVSALSVLWALSAMTVAALAASCGRKPEPIWFPLNSGASWRYAVTTETDNLARQSIQSIRVTGHSQLRGQPVYTRRSEASDNIGVEYLLQVRDDAIVRIAQRTDLQALPVADEKPRTVMPLPLALGASWNTLTVSYAVLRRTEYPRELKYGRQLMMTYTVESMDEKVEVPAGVFEHCARVEGRADLTIYADPVSGFRKTPIRTTEWYCKGVGLVKLLRTESIDTSFFIGGKVAMVLTDYSIP